ncbi:hypothetical protein JCM11491_004765 [Sporobolomyces phaffii]
MELPTPPANNVDAPTYALTPTVKAREFTTVEYPAPISLSHTSLETALSTLTSLDNLAGTTPVELDLAPLNPYFHKVPATVVASNNIVVKLTKRRRKNPRRDANGNVVELGQYTIEPLGLERRLVRFRAMADFQYVPKLERADPVINLVDAIRHLDLDAIRNFRMPEPSEDFTDPSRFIPPPVFSRHGLPQNFDMRPAGGAVRVTTESGVTRLVNSTRYKTRTMQSILFVDPNVPTGPDPGFLKELKRTEPNAFETALLELLRTERPVWTRTALLNQLTKDQLKYVSNNKSVWPMIGYTFGDGPFRDLVIRFSYDPRQDPSARFYQHFGLRNLGNVRTKALPGSKGASQAASALARHQQNLRGRQSQGASTGDESASLSSPKRSHIFDGVQLHSKIGNYQLVDVHDPLSRALIDSDEGVLATCSADPNEGWYAYDYLDQIKQVVRRKFIGLVTWGVQIADEDCDDLLGWELDKSSRRAGTGTTTTSSRARERRDKTAQVLERKLERQRKGGSGGSDATSPVETDDEDGARDGEVASGTGSDSADDSASVTGLRKKPRHPVRAPWELPKKKKRRPKVAETEEDMLARLQRKARASTTTGFPSSSALSSRRASYGTGDDDDDDDNE